MPLMPAKPSTEDPPEVERADATLRGKMFKTWLRDNADRDEYRELDVVINKSGDFFKGAKWMKFNFDSYSEELMRASRYDLIEALFIAETEWRADAAASRGARVHMGLRDAEKVAVAASPLTAEMPSVIVQCGWKDRTDTQCPDASIPGAIRCSKHGGEWLDPKIRQQLLMASYMRIVEASEWAVEALIHVAVHGRREEARVMAAKELLDRAGIRAGIDIHVVHESGDANRQISVLHERLDRMAEGLDARDEIMRTAQAAAREAAEAEIVDAEIVEDLVEVLEDTAAAVVETADAATVDVDA